MQLECQLQPTNALLNLRNTCRGSGNTQEASEKAFYVILVAELLLARYAVTISVHLGPWAILQHPGCLFAG